MKKPSDAELDALWAWSRASAMTPVQRRALRRRALPSATRRALDQMASGNLNRHEDADDLFRRLGIALPE